MAATTVTATGSTLRPGMGQGVTDLEIRRLAILMRDIVEDCSLLPGPDQITWTAPDTTTSLWMYAAADARRLGLTAERFEMMIEDDRASAAGFARVLRQL